MLNNNETFNKTELLFNHIDRRIINLINSGKTIDEVIETLETTHKNFQSKVLSNSTLDSRFRYVYTHNIVISKRIEDFYFIKTLQWNYKRFSSTSLINMFNLIKLRDKLDKDKLVVEISADFVIP